MKKVLISLMIVLLFVVVSCGGDEDEVVKKNFPHEHGGLNWSDVSSNRMSWDDAVTYCKNLGGRLPTISELRTLIQNCPGSETGGECGVTDGCLGDDCWNDPCDGCEYDKNNPGKYSVFGDTDRFWSSSSHVSNTNVAWYVLFNDGYVLYNYKTSTYYARCLR